ncbi:MAG TPA: type II toxin-antitoxin system PemK/MazF family toxin [Acidobacteria bacterium]|nr:type II toxin-antitoxin system PemK/MazF family toxin [Acidobacteriota bacterium]
MGVVRRFDVYTVELDPTRGSEIRKTRPCVIVSPDEMHVLRTVIVAPMTTAGKAWPTRVAVTFQDRQGYVVLDQIRTIDRSRLLRRLGRLDRDTARRVLSVLREMFAE